MNSEDNVLNKTRAEEFDADIWGSFYIPPYFNKLSLQNATKSTYIVGKRGCGKTMLLKFLDYHTMFSPKRYDISNDEIKRVGIYWRVDTHFCNSLNKRGIEEENWTSYFDSYFGIVIVAEIINALRVISQSSYEQFKTEDFNSISIKSAPDFYEEFPSDIVELEGYLTKLRRKFTTCISNIKTMEMPVLPPGKDFIDAIISDIKRYPNLKDISFNIYLDEVENLVNYQRKLLNTYVKHSQKPFIVNFTSKEQPGNTSTVGSESINATNDFNLVDIDSVFNGNDTKRFFSEVFLANLDAEKNTSSKLIEALTDRSRVESRANKEYEDEIVGRINSIFLCQTLKEHAEDAVSTLRLKLAIIGKINDSLNKRNSKLTSDDFLRFSDNPQLFIVLPILLSRPRNNPEKLLLELVDQANSDKVTNWIDNHLFGALLELYRPYGLGCPLYSGFDSFVSMSNGNLRHFLILCYQSKLMARLSGEDENKLSPSIQAKAAYQASEQLINEIRTFAPEGERLRIFTLRLGTIFKALQASPTMSEPEQNQFAITSGRAFDEKELCFIKEATKHGVIFNQPGTKSKNKIGVDFEDFQLNPIYAPYFSISYRKKRKLEISTESFYKIAFGSLDDFKSEFRLITKSDDINEIAFQGKFW
jgi:hypothetical protein